MPDDSDVQGAGGYLFALGQLSSLVVEFGKEQREGFADIRARLDSKVDKADLARLEAEVEQLERSKEEAHRAIFSRLTDLERRDEREEGRREATEFHRANLLTTKQKWGAVIGSIALISATFCGPLIAAHIH